MTYFVWWAVLPRLIYQTHHLNSTLAISAFPLFADWPTQPKPTDGSQASGGDK